MSKIKIESKIVSYKVSTQEQRETEAKVEETVATAMAYNGPCVIETCVSLNHISPSARIDQIEAR